VWSHLPDRCVDALVIYTMHIELAAGGCNYRVRIGNANLLFAVSGVKLAVGQAR